MTETESKDDRTEPPGPVERFLRIFSDVRGGEGADALLMLVTIFLLLIAYYVIKVVREPLILAVPDGARIKSYSSAGQAIVLLGFVPFYGWFASRVNRRKLILSVGVFFIACVQLFVFATAAEIPFIGVFFYIWVGIFSLSCIAQFWSFANDVYSKDQGARLFPIIAVGATAGSPVGSWVAKLLFDGKIAIPVILQIAAVILVAHFVLMLIVHNRLSERAARDNRKEEALSKEGGFSLVFKSRFLLLMALFFMLLNVVNTVGEYIVSAEVSTALKDALQGAGLASLPKDAAEVKEFSKNYFGSFYGSYFMWANIIAVTVQAFFVSRIVKYGGTKAVVLLLPLISVSAYTLMAVVGGISLVRWAKTAENVGDYSVMNTGRAMLWLPTSREEKYKAKQAVDTFFVRFGDVLAAGLVFAGSELLSFSTTAFSVTNVVLGALWIILAVFLLREHHKLSKRKGTPNAAAPRASS